MLNIPFNKHQSKLNKSQLQPLNDFSHKRWAQRLKSIFFQIFKNLILTIFTVLHSRHSRDQHLHELHQQPDGRVRREEGSPRRGAVAKGFSFNLKLTDFKDFKGNY